MRFSLSSLRKSRGRQYAVFFLWLGQSGRCRFLRLVRQGDQCLEPCRTTRQGCPESSAPFRRRVGLDPLPVRGGSARQCSRRAGRPRHSRRGIQGTAMVARRRPRANLAPCSGRAWPTTCARSPPGRPADRLSLPAVHAQPRCTAARAATRMAGAGGREAGYHLWGGGSQTWPRSGRLDVALPEGERPGRTADGRDRDGGRRKRHCLRFVQALYRQRVSAGCVVLRARHRPAR